MGGGLGWCWSWVGVGWLALRPFGASQTARRKNNTKRNHICLFLSRPAHQLRVLNLSQGCWHGGMKSTQALDGASHWSYRLLILFTILTAATWPSSLLAQTSFIRVHQTGYVSSAPKRAYLM